MQYLNRKRALELIPLVVDNELPQDECRAFTDFILQDEVVRCEFESHKKIKKMMQERYRRVRAPDHLRKKIQHLIDEEDLK